MAAIIIRHVLGNAGIFFLKLHNFVSKALMLFLYKEEETGPQ